MPTSASTLDVISKDQHFKAVGHERVLQCVNQVHFLAQVLPIQKMDAITAMLPVTDFPEDSYLLMLTERGSIKRTPLSLFKDQALKKGLTAIKLKVASFLLCSDPDAKLS